MVVVSMENVYVTMDIKVKIALCSYVIVMEEESVFIIKNVCVMMDSLEITVKK